MASKLYIIDANTMIEAANVYYAFDHVPGFWDWLAEQCEAGIIRSASMVKDEIEYPEELVAWVKDCEANGLFIDVSDPGIQTEFKSLASWIVSQSYGPEHIVKFLDGADPWIIAAAKVMGAKVVTQEKSVGSSSKKIKIPDVCAKQGVDCINTFELMKELNAKI